MMKAQLSETDRKLLTEIRDHLISLRVDLAPLSNYFGGLLQAAHDQEAENGRLPLGFPAADKLTEAGITTVAEVPRKSSTLRHLGLSPNEVTEVLASLMHDHNML